MKQTAEIAGVVERDMTDATISDITDTVIDETFESVIVTKWRIDADVVVGKHMCYATPDGTIADLRAVLLEDEVMEANDRFYVASTMLGKSAEKQLKWKNIVEHAGIVIVNRDALNVDTLMQQVPGCTKKNNGTTSTNHVDASTTSTQAQTTAGGEPEDFSPISLESGTIHTKHENPAAIHFTIHRSEQLSPRVLLGLNALEFSRGHDLCLGAIVEHVNSSGAQLKLERWGGAEHESSGCAWLALPPSVNDNGQELQCGRFDTTEVHPWDKIQETTTRYMKFSHAYTAPPQVVVWLDRLDMNYNAADVRVRVRADGISSAGFVLHVESWNDTKLYGVGVAWLAYDARRTDISSGTYSTDDVRPPRPPKTKTEGCALFADARFASVPQVFMALNSIHFSKNRNVRLKQLTVTNVTTRGMTWHIDSWDDTELYSASVSFVAF